jgi:hypothetical protein
MPDGLSRLAMGVRDQRPGRAHATCACGAWSPRRTGSLPSRPVMRMIFLSSGGDATRVQGGPGLPGVPAHPRERPQATGVAKAQAGHVQQDISTVGVDDVTDVTAGPIRRRGIELAGERHRGLPGLADQAAQGEHARQTDGAWQLLPAQPGRSDGPTGAVAHRCPSPVMRVRDRTSLLLTGRFWPLCRPVQGLTPACARPLVPNRINRPKRTTHAGPARRVAAPRG